jgi:hypothetical protein
LGARDREITLKAHSSGEHTGHTSKQIQHNDYHNRSFNTLISKYTTTGDSRKKFEDQSNASTGGGQT